MKIAICDDNELSAKLVYDTILRHPSYAGASIDIYTTSTDLENAVKKSNNYDIYFLDIEMPKLNGIELGKFIKNKYPKTFLVFVTSFPQYAIEAYDCEAFNYLLKPLDEGKTTDILNRLYNRYKRMHIYHNIKVKTENLRVLIKDIYYVECCNKHVIYYTKDKDYDTVGNISDAYEALKEYGFQQVHQGYIVNMDKISHFDKYAVILIDGRSVQISVRKRTEVISAYAKYIEEHT